MTAPLRRALLCFLVATLAVLAHAPLFGSGFVGGDLRLLSEVAQPERAWTVGPLTWFAEGDVRPIPAAVLSADARMHGGTTPLEPFAAFQLRLIAFVALMVGAAGAGVTLRRVLVPWLGESAARAAGWACAGLTVAHPVSVAAVARPGALGDLLALAAGAWCTAFFLRGRQQRRDRFLVFSALLAIAAGFASSAAWFLPFACAVLEFTSAHRPRVFGRRFAAAATVALVAAVAVAIEAGFAWPRDFGWRDGTPFGVYARGFAGEPVGPFTARGHGFDPVAALNALGVLFVPVPAPGAAAAFFACGALLLLAAEPLLRAVRAAPRLWGWLVLGWLAAIALTLALARDLDVPPGRVEVASALMLPAVLVCAALATAATALGGSRRTVLPLAIAAGLCILSERTAWLWPDATRGLLELRADLERALSTAGHEGMVYAIGAPEESPRPFSVHDYDGRSFGAPHDLDLVGAPWPPPAWLVASARRLHRVRAEDLGYLVRVPSGVAVRERGLAVLLHDVEHRPVLRIPPPSGPAKAESWSVEYQSPVELEFDPLALTAVRVTPRVGISTAEPPRMGWRSTNPLYQFGAIEGAWIATDDGPQAVFDLWRSNEWLLGGKIRRIWFEKELFKIVRAEVLPGIPLAGLRMEASGLVFELPEAERPRAWSGDAEWFSLHVYGQEQTVWDSQCQVYRDGSILVNFAAGLCNAESPWRLVECRVAGVTVARTQPLGGWTR